MVTRSRASVASTLLLLAAAACADTASVVDVDPNFNKNTGKGSTKTTSDPVINTVEPSWGRQGEQLAGVRIIGSNFAPDATALWERNSQPDPRITVHATRFVSATELEADISIAADAELALYDVAVMSGGKRGVGIERFEVTSAEAIAPFCSGSSSMALGVNDAGEMVGQSCGQAFYRDESGGTVSLGEGIATGIADNGAIIVGAAWSGYTAATDGPALTWTRLGASWLRAELPSENRSARANAIASDASGDPLYIAGNLREPVNRKTEIVRAVVWIRSGGAWSLQRLPIPAGVSSSMSLRARDVNAAGHVTGGAVGVPVVWERTGASSWTATVLPGTGDAHGISPDGSMVVGVSNNRAALWRRSGSGWSQPLFLGTCSPAWANAVTAAGTIGGRACGVAAIWRVNGDDVSETRLRGLGPSNTSQEVWGASSSYLVGNAQKSAVFWMGMF